MKVLYNIIVSKLAVQIGGHIYIIYNAPQTHTQLNFIFNVVDGQHMTT